MSNSKSLQANTGGASSYKKKNHYKLKDGDFVARIVPPMTKFTDDPRGWVRFHSVHFGYKNAEGKLRTFESPLVKNNKTQEIEVADAALDRLNDLQAKLLKAREEGNAPLSARLNSLVGFKGVYNIDKNYHMNVITLDGQIGELKIRHKAKVDLDREIKRLEAEGFKPLSEDAGVFFVFHRDGLSKDTNFKVSAYTVKVDLPGGGKANQEVTHKITPELWTRLEEEAFDLSNLFLKPTAEEVTQIVAESDLMSGKSPACDRIFDDRWKARRAGSAQEETAPSATQVAAPAPVVTPQVATSAPVAQAVLSPVVTTPAAVQPSVIVKNTPAVSSSASLDEMSDDDFFKLIGTTA